MSQDRIAREMEAIWRSEQSGAGFLMRLAARLIVRTSRIAGGLAFLCLGIWAGVGAWDELGKPLAAQSFLGIIWGLFLGMLAFGLISAAGSAAFGRGPTLEEDNQRRQRIAINRIGKIGLQGPPAVLRTRATPGRRVEPSMPSDRDR